MISHNNAGTFPISIIEIRHESYLLCSFMNWKISTISMGNLLSYDENSKARKKNKLIFPVKKAQILKFPEKSNFE